MDAVFSLLSPPLCFASGLQRLRSEVWCTIVSTTPRPSQRSGWIAQLVEHWTQEPGWCGFGSQVQQGIFHCKSALSADSLIVFAQPLCAVECLKEINVCTHVKKPKQWQPSTTIWTHNNCMHMQEWVALLRHPGKAIQFPCKGLKKCIL